MRDAHDRNDYEAQAIADEIAAIFANEKLAGRTMRSVNSSRLRETPTFSSRPSARVSR
jgi:hypothetical protein